MYKLRLLGYIFISCLGGGIMAKIIPNVSQMECILYLLGCAILSELLSWKQECTIEENKNENRNN